MWFFLFVFVLSKTCYVRLWDNYPFGWVNKVITNFIFSRWYFSQMSNLIFQEKLFLGWVDIQFRHDKTVFIQRNKHRKKNQRHTKSLLTASDISFKEMTILSYKFLWTELCPPKFPHWSHNFPYLRMWLYLELGPLKGN